MKKIIVIILTAILATTMVACSQTAEDTETSQNGETTSTTEENNKTTESVTEAKDLGYKIFEDLPLEYSKLTEDFEHVVKINGPDYQQYESGNGDYFAMGDEYYINVSFAREELEETEENLQIAYELTLEKHIQNRSDYNMILSDNIESSSIENINGIDVLKFEGTVERQGVEVYDGLLIGYSFIVENEPFSIFGCILQAGYTTRPEEIEEEIRHYIDEMIQTVRVESRD